MGIIICQKVSLLRYFSGPLVTEAKNTVYEQLSSTYDKILVIQQGEPYPFPTGEMGYTW